MRIGLDFGTTNSSAVFYRDGAFTVLKSPFAEPSGILPSLIYIRKDFQTFFGRAAALAYLQDDTGRQAIWETYHAGILDYWIDMGTDTEPDPILIQDDIWLQIDTGAKGRLLQSIKTGLRSAYYAGTSIFGRFYTIQDLLALILAELHSAAEKSLGKTVEGVHLGRPVKFSENETIDRRAQAILHNAAKDAGFKQVNFMLEPVAAAYSYHDRLARRETVLVFDFGGGTLDLTVMRIGATQEPEVISTEGVLIGGDDFDQRIMEKFLLKHFGEGKVYGEGYRLPPPVFDALLSWPRHPDLSRGHYYHRIWEAVRASPNDSEFNALLSLIDQKHGYRLFEAIEQAKFRLSEQAETLFSFHIDGIHIDERITRQAFSESIADYVEQIEAGVEAVLRKAGLSPQQIGLVLCTGGSSAVPAVKERLIERFGAERIRQYDPFLAVSRGLAIAACGIDPGGRTNGK